MRAKRALLGWVGWWVCLVAAWADPAVLLKEYSAQIIRGHYVLGRRTVRVGEIVTVQSIRGVNAEVTTSDNDRLSVRLADLRTLPEPTSLRIANPAPKAVAQPEVTPGEVPGAAAKASPAGVAVPATPTANPGVLNLLAASARPPGTLVPGATVITSGAELIAERRTIKVRCTHLTKKGTQCSRMTDSPNGLCWQHGGD